MAAVNGSAAYSPSAASPGDLTATYIVQTADASLPNAQALGLLATGLLKVTTTTGALSNAAKASAGAGGDYLVPTGVAGGQTLIGGTASGNALTLSSNASNDGAVVFGAALTNPSKWFDSVNANGNDFFGCWTGKNGGGERQAVTLGNRGSSVGDDVSIGFGPITGGTYDGGPTLSKTRIVGTFANPSNYSLVFKVGIGGVSTEMFRLDGANTTVNILKPVTLSEAANIAVGATTGTKFGTSTTQKMAFWNATPVVQQARPTDAATIISTGTTLGLWA